MKRRIIGTLVCLALLLGFVPGMAATARADGVTVTHDADEIRELLRQDGDVTIQLDADAEKNLDFYFEREYETEQCYNRRVWAKLGSGNKTIDLNGHRLYINDKTYDWGNYIWQAVLMEIPTGTSLTVNDSAVGGKIWMDTPMNFDIWFEGNTGIKIRDIFAVTGGDLTVNGGEIHAGRAKQVWEFYVTKEDKNWQWPGTDWYEEWYEKRGETPEEIGSIYYTGYATQFNSGTAITVYSGNVTINGGEFWGRGWDNISLISRVPNNPNGADDHRDRCAAIRVRGGQVTINSGSFYGRSDADAIQVLDSGNLMVHTGTFDVGSNSYLVYPPIYRQDVTFLNSDQENVIVGYTGSFGVPDECIDDQSVKVVKGNTMTLYKNAIDPYKVIDEINLYINSPLAYETPAEEVYNVPDGCTVESVTWYKNGAKVENPGSTYFEKGADYYLKIALSVNYNAGTKFKNNLTDVTINGKDAELYRADTQNIVLTVHFGECIAALENLAFEVETPVEGQFSSAWVDSSAYEMYDAVGGYSNYGDFRQWYVSDDGENWSEMSSDDTFEAGRYYRFSFEVHAGEGQEFAVDASGVSVQPDVTATVNGISATVSKAYEQDPSEHITVTVDFGACPALIQSVEFDVAAPRDGQAISYGVTAGDSSYYAISGGDTGTYRCWYESDTGLDGWTEMTPGSTFTAGKYYKFEFDVNTIPGYVFSTYDDGVSIQPNVGACVNQYGANVSKMFEQDPARSITVSYIFGYCNASVVNEITVTNVTPPVAGQKPNYTYSIEGNGYQMDTSRNAYYDVYWKNPPEQWYYVKNGLGWWDTTTGSWDYVYENDTFIPGHTYACQLYLIAEDGFHFRNMSEHDALPTVTVNGYTAEINEGWTNATEARVYYTFTCSAKEVSAIKLTGLTPPQAGETPDTEVTSAEPDDYVVDSVQWLDVEDHVVNSFEEGQYYIAEITVRSREIGGADVCTFTGGTTAYIDGVEAAGWNNSVTVNGDNTVTVRYAFRRPACAPAAEDFIPIFSANIAIAMPEEGAAPQTEIAETDEYTGTITWSGSPAVFELEHGAVYTASVTLTAKAGYAFSFYASAKVVTADWVGHKTVSPDGCTLSFDVEYLFIAPVIDEPEVTGLVELNGEWIYAVDGNKDASFTGLVENEYGWWYVVNGQLGFDYTGLVNNEYGWWYVTGSRLDFGYTGLVENENGWWYVVNGRLGFDYTGLVNNEYGWWYVTDNRLDLGYTGLVENENGWWYVVNGQLGFDYTGLVNNEYGWWYVRDSRLDFGYTGQVTNEYGTWNVVNGQVVF